MARSVSRDRTVCESCDLPFYAEEGECPYCGADGGENSGTEDSEFVFDNSGPAHRTRTTCPDCGLSHYEDADECPYCAYAGSRGEASAEGGRAGTTEPARTDGPTGDESGLFGRIKRALGF